MNEENVINITNPSLYQYVYSIFTLPTTYEQLTKYFIKNNGDTSRCSYIGKLGNKCSQYFTSENSQRNYI